ncbi:MAG TPA: GldG family protein [Candidatus Gracilibacteria bacterium]|nr:GldG family protein [Candidatus Gracilibacteria bacterium]
MLKFYRPWLVAFALILLNVLSLFWSYRLDFTENQLYTLSKSTKQILKDLKQPLEIKVFMSEKLPAQVVNIRQNIQDSLQEYQRFGGSKLKISYIDPAGDEKMANLAQYLSIPELQLQSFEKDQTQVMKAYMGLAVLKPKKDYKADPKDTNPLAPYDKHSSLPVLQNVSNFEYDLSAAILKVNTEKAKKVAFVKGHGEHELTMGQMQAMFGDKGNDRQDYDLEETLNKNYEVQSVSLTDDLAEIDTLVLAGPQEEIPEEELTKLHEFVKNGKNLVLLLDRMEVNQQMLPKRPNGDWEKLLSPWGIKILPQILLDKNHAQASFSMGGFMTFSLPYPFWVRSTNLNQDNAITAHLENVVLPWVSPLQFEAKTDVKTEVLLSSSSYYALEPMFEMPKAEEKKTEDAGEEPKTEVKPETPAAPPVPQARQIDFDPQQNFASLLKAKEQKPLPLAILAQEKNAGKVLVVGNSNFINQSFAQQFPSNLAFFMNAMDVFNLGDQLVSIRAKNLIERPIMDLSPVQKNLIRWSNILFLPFLVLVYGGLRLFWRRTLKKQIS